MKVIRIVLLLFGIIQFSNAYSYGCRDTIDRKNAVSLGLKYYEIVFLGDLIITDTVNSTYSFKILELFKGHTKSDTIWGRVTSRFSAFPTVLGLYLVYANFNNDSTIDINECGPTNSMAYPYYCNPPPPSVIQSANLNPSERLETEINAIKYYNNGIRNWFKDLEKLRNYKSSKIDHVVTKKIDYKIIFLTVSFVLNVIMFIALLIKFKK